jgi:hypothetical protein
MTSQRDARVARGRLSPGLPHAGFGRSCALNFAVGPATTVYLDTTYLGASRDPEGRYVSD